MKKRNFGRKVAISALGASLIFVGASGPLLQYPNIAYAQETAKLNTQLEVIKASKLKSYGVDEIHIDTKPLGVKVDVLHGEVATYTLNGVNIAKDLVMPKKWYDKFVIQDENVLNKIWKAGGGNTFKVVFNDGSEYIYNQPLTPQETTTTSTTTTSTTATPVAPKVTTTSQVPSVTSATTTKASTVSTEKAATSTPVTTQVPKVEATKVNVEIVEAEKYSPDGGFTYEVKFKLAPGIDGQSILDSASEFHFNDGKLRRGLVRDGHFIVGGSHVDRWKDDGGNTYKIVFKDGTSYTYTQPSKTSSTTETTTTTTTTTSTTTSSSSSAQASAPKVEVVKAEAKENWQKKKVPTFEVSKSTNVIDVEKAAAKYVFNGKDLEVYFGVSVDRFLPGFKIDNEEARKLWREGGGNQFKVVFKDGTEYVYNQPIAMEGAAATESTTSTTTTQSSSSSTASTTQKPNTTESTTSTTTTTTTSTTTSQSSSVQAANPKVEITDAKATKDYLNRVVPMFYVNKATTNVIDVEKQTAKYIFNGKDLAVYSGVTAERFAPGFRVDDKEAVKLWKEEGGNELTIVFKDGTKYTYTQPSTTSPKEETTTSTTTTQTSTTQAGSYPNFIIKSWEKIVHYAEAHVPITLDVNFREHRSILANLDYYELAGKKRNKSEIQIKNGLMSIVDPAALDVWKEDAKLTLVMKDGRRVSFPADPNDSPPKVDSTTTTSKTTEKPKEETTSNPDVKKFVAPTEKLEKLDLTLKDKLPDGEYTIGFGAFRADGIARSSMLEGFFDKNVKLVVKDGKKHIVMLNTMFADGLLDFRLQANDGSWPVTKKEDFGKANIDGKYKNALFTIPLEDLENERLGAVLVTYMGGFESQRGDISKYAKLKLNLKTPIYKGWNGYEHVAREEFTKADSDRVLNTRLLQNEGIDTNRDGKVSAEELQNYKGTLNLQHNLYDKNDDHRDAIYDLSLLKNVGPGVTKIDLSTNKLSNLPADAFKNATGLKEINIASNDISNLPEDLFKNNPNLEVVTLSSNKLGKLPANLFANNNKIKKIDLSQAWLSEISKDAFANLPELESISLNDNNMNSLADDVFKNNPKLKFINLNGNSLRKLPTSIANLSNLEVFRAKGASLETLPEGLEKLEKLKTLDLSNNNLKEIPEAIWKNLAKNGGTIEISNNNISSIPLDIIKSGKLSSINLAYNNLPTNVKDLIADPNSIGLDATRIGKYFPQKGSAQVTISADNKQVSVKNGELGLLDLIFWYWEVQSKQLDSKEKYLEYVNAEKAKLNTDLAGVFSAHKSFKWIINTVVERERNGVKTVIKETSDENKLDQEINIQDPDMKDGDIYRVKKIINVSRGGIHGFEPILSTSASVKAKVAEDKKEEKKAEKPAETASKLKTYQAPVSLVNVITGGASMGNAAINPVATIVETADGGQDIILTFKTMETAGMKGNLLKLSSAVNIDDAKNGINLSEGVTLTTRQVDGQVFPESIKIHRNTRGEKDIPARVWVDAMEAIAKLSGQKDGSQPVLIRLDLAKSKVTEETPTTSVKVEETKPVITKVEESPVYAEFLTDKQLEKEINNEEYNTAMVIDEPMTDIPVLELPLSQKGKSIFELGKPSVEVVEKAKKVEALGQAPKPDAIILDKSQEAFVPKEKQEIYHKVSKEKSTSNKPKNSGTSSTGRQKVPVSLINVATGGESMGNAALIPEAEVIDTPDGGRDIILTFKTMEAMGLKGNLLKLATAANIDDASNNRGLTPATVLSTRVVDGKSVPHTIKIHRPTRTETRIPARVWVDAMEALAKANGQADGSQPVWIALKISNSSGSVTPKGEVKPTEEKTKTSNGGTPSNTANQGGGSSQTINNVVSEYRQDNTLPGPKEEGTYKVPVKMINYSTGALSMGDPALEDYAEIVDRGNDGLTIRLTFKPINVGTMRGHLTKLAVYESLVDIAKGLGAEDAKIVDYYEDGGQRYPKTFEFTRPHKEDKIGIKVNVDAMDALANGNGPQPAIVEFDWSKAHLVDSATENSVEIEGAEIIMAEEILKKLDFHVSLVGNMLDLVSKIAEQLKVTADDIKLYDIYLTDSNNDRKDVEGHRVVKLPFEREAGYEYRVYHVSEDGKLTDMNATIEGGKLVFGTDHFSYFAVVKFEEGKAPASGSADGRSNSQLGSLINGDRSSSLGTGRASSLTNNSRLSTLLNGGSLPGTEAAKFGLDLSILAAVFIGVGLYIRRLFKERNSEE